MFMKFNNFPIIKSILINYRDIDLSYLNSSDKKFLIFFLKYIIKEKYQFKSA